MSKRLREKKEMEEEKAASIKFPLTWKTKDGLIYGDNPDCKPSDKVLSFDMVSLIKYLTNFKRMVPLLL